MTIVTGDRYLESLVKFVEKQAGPLIEGTLVLKLNPVGLHYVQSRLESLAELERLLAGAPVDYLRAYVSDLGDHRALEQLRRILRLLTSLKVISVLPPPSRRDPTPLCLLPFGRLKVLELRGCDLSTSAARGLLELRHTLEKIICHNSTDALRHVFASRIAEIKDSPQWRRLSFVSCAYNGLVLMDDSLRLLPVVETLDLSRNKFAKVDNILKCGKLKHLDLGFNQLRTIASLSKVTCQIVKLVLRNNALTNLRGVENLKSLEGLDLSYNIISDISELELLAGLPSLQGLWLEGNPVCSASWYRAQVYSFFPDPDKLILDDKKIGTREVWKRQIIIASRHKQPASFGYYSPAIDEAELEGSINAKRKKLSRLASIESETNTVVYSDNDSLTCIDEGQSKQEIADSNDGAEVVDFINKIEFKKRECSGLWVEEFKQWMSHISQDFVESDIHSGSDLTPCKESDSKKKRRQKHFGETSRYASKSIEASGDENSMELSESFTTCDDLSTIAESQRYSYQVGEADSKYITQYADKDVCAPHHKKLGSHYNGGVNPIRNTRSHIDFQVLGEEGMMSNNKKVQGVEVTSPDNNFMPLDAIDDVIEARSPSACAGSPPHYQEHILHRRHNMEEEFLQLSAESYSVASSDSYTSNSGDDPVEVGSLIHNASTDDDVSRRVDIPSVSHLSEDSYCDKRHEMSHFMENGTYASSACSDYTFDMELKESDTQQSHNSYEGGPYEGEIIRLVKQEANWLEKKICNRKPKRRVVSLTEKTTNPLTYETCNDEVMKSSNKLNCSARVNRDVQDAYRREADMNGDLQMLADQESSINNMGGEIFPGEKSSAPRTEEFISNYLNEKLAAVGVQETCMQYICCNCVLDDLSGCHESEVVVLLSNEQKVYILLLNGRHDGSGSCPSRVGTFGAEDVKEVLVGLGLQAVRVYIRRGARFMFITRSTEKSRQLISILEFLNSQAKKGGFPLISLDQIQVALFERGICGGSRTNILQYSMVLFWNDILEEDQWLSRSLFVLGGHMLVCIEDISQFGFDNQDAFTPYYTLDSCCSIVNALEMVIETDERWCVTLTLESVMSEFCLSDSDVIKNRSASNQVTWKLKWFSEDGLFKFLHLLKALRAGASSSPLIIRRRSS